MNNSNDSIDAELATLDKLLELSTNTAAEKNNSLLKKTLGCGDLASEKTKKRKLLEMSYFGRRE